MAVRNGRNSFAIVARFTGGAPADGWMDILPDGVVIVRQKGRRTAYLSTLDGLASRVVWQDAQRKALDRARAAKDKKRLQRAARAARRG